MIMTILLIVSQVLLAWIYSHVLEYFFLRYLNTRLLKKESSLKNHNRICRRNVCLDNPDPKSGSGYFKTELRCVLLILAFHLPVCIFFPYAFLSLALNALSYIAHHRICHSSSRTAREFYSWHYDGHMSRTPGFNFGMRSQVMDLIFKTRKVYKGTKHERLAYGRGILKQRRMKLLARAYAVSTKRVSALEHESKKKNENDDKRT